MMPAIFSPNLSQSQQQSPDAAFVNEPFLDFTQPDTRRSMQDALAKVKAKLGREYDLVIGGKRVKTQAKITSINPARPAEIVGVHQAASDEHGGHGIEGGLA